MRKPNLSKLTGAIMIALIPIVTSAIAGDKPAPAQTGIVIPTGSQSPGGTIGYSFALSTLEAGSLTVKASIKAGSWKANFPDLNINPIVGLSAVDGPAISVPADVQGTASLKVNVKFNKKNITKRTIQVVFGPPQPVPGTAKTTLYDVGFENGVTLNGSIVPTSGMGSPLTYNWSQTSGKTVVLSPSGMTAGFTTDALTNFVDMAEKFGEIDGIGLDAEQVTESTYGFKVLVSDGTQTRTGLYTVVCSSPSPKQPNVPVGLLAYFKADTNSTDWSLLSTPAGSAATLAHADSVTPALRPDVEGTYVIKDNVSGQIRTNTAASWTGVEFCAICHGPGNDVGNKDMVTPWSQTGHAGFFKEMINEGPAYYNESCIYCHTVGYNKTPSAQNGGFDDVAAANGWKFPSSINSNNWNSIPLPVQKLANIQCESCHGPGSRHPGATSVSLNVAVCAQCHQDGHYHTRVEQWELSPHFKGFREVSEEEGENSTCSRCHAPDGYVDVAKRVANGQDIVTASATNNYAKGIGELICQGCHDPHHTFDNPDRKQLRFFDEAVIGAPAAAGSIVLSNQGVSATCVYCHNSRRLPLQLSVSTNSNSQYYKSIRSGQLSGPHESTAAEVFNGLGAITYGVTMGNTFHTYGANCVDCHMYPNPAIGQPGHNQVGDHTFNMVYNNGSNDVENIAACNQCHSGTFAVDEFDFQSAAAKDWDGTNGVQGVQSETEGLLDHVRTLLNTSGVLSVTNASGEYTGFYSAGLSTNAVIKDAQQKAAWNWMLITRDRSEGVHNPLFTVRLLQNTYTDLSTNYYGDASRTFTNAFPNASLR